MPSNEPDPLKAAIIAEAEQSLRDMCAPFKAQVLRMRYMDPAQLDKCQRKTSDWRPEAPKESEDESV